MISLYKADDTMQFNHYRPVSLLRALSKVFEKVMYSRLISFVNKFSILHENQFGFLKSHSTHMASLTLIDKLVHAIENGEYVKGVFLDFSKAFDMVNHHILLDKLYHYGICGCAHKWLKSYLTNRTQFVTYNSIVSDHQMKKCGVPQGSILGPLLFRVYVNDLPSVCSSALPILFADDTNLFLSGSDPTCIENRMNDDLKKIAMWLKVNRLSLNI